jgi:predicted DNA-binding mobile mystery protein A
MADPFRATARRHLDASLTPVRESALDLPADGWIRTLRQALGMSAVDLGVRMGITRAAVRRLEESERAGTIKLDTLNRAAEALGARVTYALTPIASLEQQVHDQALAVAARELGRVNHSMALEEQLPASIAEDELVRARARELLESPRLWSLPQ